MKPKLFIGSSKEDLELAKAVNNNLDRIAEVSIWHLVFKPSQNYLDSLLNAAENADYGVFILSPEDSRTMRNRKSFVPRDNVIFEYGLFVGRLGKERCFMVVPREGTPVGLPTDLLGITPLTYDPTRGDKGAALLPACNQIEEIIKTTGVLPRGNYKIRIFDEFKETDLGKYGAYYIKGTEQVFKQALLLYKSAEKRIIVVQFAPGPKAPEFYAENAAKILREKKKAGKKIVFNAYVVMNLSKIPPDFKDRNEARLKIYEQYGVRDQVTLKFVDSRIFDSKENKDFSPCGFEVFIVDSNHAHIGFSYSIEVNEVQRAIVLEDRFEMVKDLEDWVTHHIMPRAVPYHELVK